MSGYCAAVAADFSVVLFHHSLLAVLVAAVWGGNFVASKIGVSYFPPVFYTALRFAVTGATLLPFVMPLPHGRWKNLLALSAVLGTLHFPLLVAALRYGLDISSCAVVGQLGVPFSCLLGALLLRDRLGLRQICGMAIAFAGIAIVAGTPNVLAHPLGFALALGGAFWWGCSNIFLKHLTGLGVFQTLVWISLFATPQLLLASWLIEGNAWPLLASPPPQAALAGFYTAFGSTIVAYGLWYWLLRRYPVSQVAPFSLLTPVFGIAFGDMLLGETLTWQASLGGALTVAGVGMIVIKAARVGAAAS